MKELQDEATQNHYDPDYTVHPGEILEENLSSLGMTTFELSSITGIFIENINEIIKGQSPITLNVAIRLGLVFEKPARFWSNLQLIYNNKNKE